MKKKPRGAPLSPSITSVKGYFWKMRIWKNFFSLPIWVEKKFWEISNDGEGTYLKQSRHTYQAFSSANSPWIFYTISFFGALIVDVTWLFSSFQTLNDVILGTGPIDGTGPKQWIQGTSFRFIGWNYILNLQWMISIYECRIRCPCPNLLTITSNSCFTSSSRKLTEKFVSDRYDS